MIVILDNLRSAQNVGSIIRTCDALGIKEVHLCGITPDTEDRKVLKTSLGAEENVKCVIKNSTFDDITSLKNSHTIVGLELSDKSIAIDELKGYSNIAIVIGNEISGLSEEIMSQCDLLVQIPMKGIKESLNVAVAFGIAAYEITKPLQLARQNNSSKI